MITLTHPHTGLEIQIPFCDRDQWLAAGWLVPTTGSNAAQDENED